MLPAAQARLEAEELILLAPRRLLAATLFVTAPGVAAAQEGKLDLSGTMRVRLEAIANQPRPGFDRDDSLLNLRTTLRAAYEDGPLTVAAELWDSRVYGDGPGSAVTTGEVNAVELVQAYVAYQPRIAGTELVATAGRFLLNIGSRRLVAADDYRNTTNGYTGLRADIARPGGLTATLIYVLPQQRRPDDRAALARNPVAVDREGFDLALWGGTAAHPIGSRVAAELSFYRLNERDTPGRPTRDRQLATYGGRLHREPAAAAADFEVEGFYQSGRSSVSTGASAGSLPVSAWFVHADAGYTLAGAWKPRVSIEYDRASGDRAGGSSGRFDTLFGMRRADLAPSGLYNAIGRANLSTPGARVEIVPSKRVDAFASYHALYLAERTDSFSTTGVRDASGRSGDFAGHQLDARLRWWVRPAALRFEANAVMLTKGRFLATAPNAPAGGTTAYGSVNLIATF